jgi:hypothetical protein
MNLEAKVSQQYEPGAVVDHSWGYDQTNHDFFVITKRTGDTVWLLPMAQGERRVERDGR